MEAGDRTPPWLWLVGGLFVALMGAVLVVSLSRPDPPVFALTRLDPREAPAIASRADTVTLDARSGDRWLLFDIERRAVTTDPEAWDLGVKRHRLVVNGGPGFRGDAAVQRLTLSDSGRWVAAGSYHPSRVTGGGDTVSAVLDDWYAYSFFSHLLQPRTETAFGLRTAEGASVRLRVLGYYCPGPEPGCLTLELTPRETP